MDHVSLYYDYRDSERLAKNKLMDFLSSAITPSEHQATPSHIVQGADSTGLLPVLSNMNELALGNSVAVSLATGANNINGNTNNQMAAFSNGIVSPDANHTAASNPSVAQIPGNSY